MNERLMLIDGYNIIGASIELKALDMTHARDRLIDMVEDYAGARSMRCIIVFDGYNSADSIGSEEELSELVSVVYTRFGLSADNYIERLCAILRDKRMTIRVATGDGTIQNIILGLGALRVPPSEFFADIERAKTETRRYTRNPVTQKQNVFAAANEAQLALLEAMRRE